MRLTTVQAAVESSRYAGTTGCTAVVAVPYLTSPSSSSQVETVGDCYVAATGLPDPRKDHALAMVRFARDCMNGMQTFLKELEGVLEKLSSLPLTQPIQPHTWYVAQ